MVVVVVVAGVVVVVEGQMSSNVFFPGALPLASAGVGG